MHELGVVFHIADTLARIAEENQVTRIRRVTLELGEVSTVVPEYLIDVWNWNCKRTPLLTGCELVIERIPAEDVIPRGSHQLALRLYTAVGHFLLIFSTDAFL